MSFGIINHNISAVNATRQLQLTNNAQNKSLERLSSGLRINRAADDAAGLAVSEKMRSQIHGLDQAERNANDAITMIQTGEGALDTTQSILQRMRKLAVQAANDSYTTYDRQRIQKEIDQLTDEIDRIAQYTEFNTKKLLNGNATGRATVDDVKVATAEVTGRVVSADYSITIIDAGTASNVHGNANIVDGVDTDYELNLRDAGIVGDQELHISVNDQTRVIDVNENDTLEDVKRKINAANMGVIAGLDAEGNDLTITSMRSGSKFNINFGDDPDGVAVKLGLFGGNYRTQTYSTQAVNSMGQRIGNSLFTSGTDTIISITNITQQTLFPTDPGQPAPDGTSIAGMYGQSLGIFRSNSDVFTEKELSNPINGMSIAMRPANQAVNLAGSNHIMSVPTSGLGAPDLTQSMLLKGISIHIDEQIDYGILQRDNNDDPFEADGGIGGTNAGWTAYFPDPNFNGNISSVSGYVDDANGNVTEVPHLDHRAAVPSEREISLPTAARAGQTPQQRFQEMSITSFKLAVRDTRQVFHIGANEDQILTADFGNMTAEALGLKTSMRANGHNYDGIDKLDNGARTLDLSLKISVETQKSAESAITTFDAALKRVSEERAKLGAFQNSLEKSVDYLNISFENMTASESRIRDVDMAREMSEFTRSQILVQSGTAMLAQANAKPQSVLSLLG